MPKNKKPKNSTPSRKLGYHETVVASFHEEMEGSCNIATAVKVIGSINEKIFRQALELLYQRHPMLRGVLKKQDDEFHIVLNSKFTDIPVTYLKTSATNKWQEIYEGDILAKFVSNKYLWRATLLQMENDKTFYLIFVFSHIISDATSIINFIRELLTIASQLTNDQTVAIKTLPLMPSVGEILNRDLFTVPTDPIDNDFRAKKYKWYFQNKVSPNISKTKNIFRELDKNTLARLQCCCKKRNISIYAASTAAMLLTCQAIRAQDPLYMKTYTAINLRKYTKPRITSDVFGFYAMQLPLKYTLHNTDKFWQAAYAYQKKLVQTIRAIDYPKQFSLTDIQPMINAGASPEREAFMFDLTVSNLGKLTMLEDVGDNFYVESCHFSLSQKMAPYGLFAGNIVLHDKMFVCFNYASPMLEDKWVNNFADRVIELIKLNIGENK